METAILIRRLREHLNLTEQDVSDEDLLKCSQRTRLRAIIELQFAMESLKKAVIDALMPWKRRKGRHERAAD